MSNFIPNMTYTSNAFLDYLLYYCKLLSFSSVIKDEDIAEQKETVESLMAGDIYISCIENNVIFELFTYTKQQLNYVGITDPSLVSRCIRDKNNIPPSYRNAITEKARQDYIDNYIELNEYYRTICGLPRINDYGIPIRDYEYHFVDNVNPWNVTYIHELNHDAIMYLEQKGILNEIRQDYSSSEYEYLDYITCNISPYTARKADNYSLLYCPEENVDELIRNKFIRKYNENRLFTIATYYTEGLKLTSPYYSSFIGMMIMLMTIMDLIAELQEHIVKKDLMDKRCIQFIFEMYGIPYYNSIPIKYQHRICKNINQLIRYKSSAQGMLNLIDLFGAENIEVFRYFILRDRNIDKWGDIVYDQVMTTEINPNDIIDHDEALLPGSHLSGSILDIPFPTEDFLESGNKLVVSADEKLLIEDTDYHINVENKLVLNKSVNDIRYDFYFNNKIGSQTINEDNGLFMLCDSKVIDNRTISYVPPYNSYILDGNDIIVCIGGTILGKDQYTVNSYNNTIVIDNSFEITASNKRNVVVLFMYGKNIVSKFKKNVVTATINNQTTFNIPEPFKNYIRNGNAFFITYRNVFIQDNRYTINTTNEIPTITFTDFTVPQGIDVVFHFIYAEATIYQEIEIQKKVVNLTVTEDFQTIFPLKDEEGNSLFPFERYIASPYKVYVSVRNYARMLDTDFYDVYGNSLVLRDTTLCLRVGEIITVYFIYGPHETMASIKTDKKYVYSTENYQTEFNIPIPEDNYFSILHGAVIIDVYGNYLEPEDYTIDEVNKKLTITNHKKTPAAGEKINLTFIRNRVSQNNINIDQQYPTIGDTYNDAGIIKPRFNISLPFANYFESKQSVLVFHNTTIIDSKRIHYKTEQDSGSTVHFIYLDDNPIEYQQSDSVIIMFIYNGLYVRQLDENIEDLVVNCSIEDIIDNDLVLSIPFPFSKYLEHGWFLYITDEDGIIVYRSENDETGIDDIEYPCEIIDNALTFIDSSVIPEYERLIFHFVHFSSPNYITEVYEEDYAANYSLKFIGVPLTDEYFNREIMKKINVLPYDPTVIEDRFWNGIAYNSNSGDLHNKVKLEILKKKFNYERTKYFGINYIINISEMSFRISYFYNILYDKNFIENNLNIKVPSIAPYKEFNIAYIFCYMTSLAYMFSGVEDYILNNFSTMLYIKGFNFNADLESIKKWLKKNFRYLAVREFDKFNSLPDVGSQNTIYINCKNKKSYQWINNKYELLENTIIINDLELLKNKDKYKDNIFISIPSIGEEGIIYIDPYTNTSYQWKNNAYIEANDTKNIIGYDIWNFVNLNNLDTILINDKPVSDGNGQIKDMDSFVRIFCNNRDIYEYIVKTIYNSQDYDIYHIWKMIYETLMTIEYNDDFYKVTLTEEGIQSLGYEEDLDSFNPAHIPGDEIVARSFKELLYYKDRELYNDIIYIENLGDEIAISDTIINRISDIVYILEDWMDSEEFHNIYDSFPGVSGDSLVNYLFTIINFFKSYKVVLRAKGDYIVFTADDPLLNTIKIIDVKDTNVNIENHEYINIKENIDAGVYLYKDDIISLRDKVFFETHISSDISERFLPLPEDYPYKTTNISTIKVKRTSHQFITIFTDNGESFTTDVTSGWVSAVERDTHDIIGMITYFNPFINRDDFINNHMQIKINDPNVSSSIQYVVLDHGFPEEYRSRFKSKVGENTYQHVLIRDTNPDSEYIEYKVEYGTEFYVYVTPDIGWNAGILNIRYGKIFDDDILVEATDATTVMRELYIFQSAHQTITLFNTGGEEITDSISVPYGAVYYYRIRAEEGYIAGTIQVSPETAMVGNTIVIEKTTTVTATSATIKTFRIYIEAPIHENISLTIGGAIIFVEAGTSQEINNIPYFTKYTAEVYSENEYTAGELNIPNIGSFTNDIQQSEGYIYITAAPAELNKYTITVEQTPHQTITVHYNDQSYSGSGSFQVFIGTIITCTIESENGYIAGILNITERIVNEDIIITATGAVEASMLLITISSGNNQTITVIYDGNGYTEDFYVPFGSSYTSYLTPNPGFTTDAEIINFMSNELRSNIVVYASKDAIPNMNTITLINPDTTHQSLRVYVNNDQSEENVKTTTFTLESGNTIMAEVISLDPDYLPGTTNIENITNVISDMTVVATEPINTNIINVTIDTIEHQDIVVVYNGTTYHSGDTFVAQALETAQVTIIPDTGYQYTHSDFVPEYTFVKDGKPITITADPPIESTYNITIVQKEHQLISVTGTVRIYHEDNTYDIIENYTTTESNVNFIYGTAFTASIISTDSDYEPGELNISAGTVHEGIIITATDPTYIDSDS